MKPAMPSNRASPRKNGHLDNFGAFRSFMGPRCRTKPPELQAQECGNWRGAPGRSNVGKRRSADLQSALNDLKPVGPARKHGHPKPTASRRSGGTRKMRNMPLQSYYRAFLSDFEGRITFTDNN